MALIGFYRWDKSTYDAAHQDRKDSEARFAHDAREKPIKERGSIAEQAKALLQGEERWSNKTEEEDEWEDVGEPVEVEQDVQVPKIER
jgi:large subunit ribosomal protein L23